MNMKDIRELSDEKLAENLGELRKELFNLRFQHTTAQLEQTHQLPEVKKTIARILTVKRERQVGA